MSEGSPNIDFFCRKPSVSTQTPIGREARNHHHHQREKERARESKTKKESERERERGEGEKGSQSLYTLKSPPPDRPPLRRPLCYSNIVQGVALIRCHGRVFVASPLYTHVCNSWPLCVNSWPLHLCTKWNGCSGTSSCALGFVKDN